MDAEWWADNAEWVVGIVGIVVTIVVAFLVYRWQRQTKRLDYSILSNVAILSSHAGRLRGRLYIAYNDIEVPAPRLVTVRVVNTGKHPVRAAEFVSPITVVYEQNQPFDGSISDSSSPEIVSSERLFEADEGHEWFAKVALKPLLLNHGEWFDLQLISNGPTGHVAVSCRFDGQDRPMKSMDREIDPILGMSVGAPLVLGVTMFAITRNPSFLVMTIGGGAPAIASILLGKRSARKGHLR